MRKRGFIREPVKRAALILLAAIMITAGTGCAATSQKGGSTVSEQEENKKDVGENSEKVIEPLKETDFLLLKSVTCPICESKFKTPAIKSGKMRRMEPDLDLRPRFEGIDVNKYDVISCPKCGYTALNRYYGRMASVQVQCHLS